jgi:hypothetical protein
MAYLDGLTLEGNSQSEGRIIPAVLPSSSAAEFRPLGWATIVKGRSVGHEIIKCNEIAGRVPFAVASCTEYNDRRMPSRADLEDIAWVLRTDSKTRTIGMTDLVTVRSSQVARSHSEKEASCLRASVA